MRIYQVQAPEAERLAIESAIEAHLGGVEPRRWEAQRADALLVVAPPLGSRERRIWDSYEPCSQLPIPELLAHTQHCPVVVTGLPGAGLTPGRQEIDGVPVITVPDLYDAIYELGAVLG